MLKELLSRGHCRFSCHSECKPVFMPTCPLSFIIGDSRPGWELEAGITAGRKLRKAGLLEKGRHNQGRQANFVRDQSSFTRGLEQTRSAFGAVNFWEVGPHISP